MQKPDEARQPTLPQKPVLFHNKRCLQQYRHHQEQLGKGHQAQPQSQGTALEEGTDTATNAEQVGLHALDSYFARELALQPVTTPSTEKAEIASKIQSQSNHKGLASNINSQKSLLEKPSLEGLHLQAQIAPQKISSKILQQPGITREARAASLKTQKTAKTSQANKINGASTPYQQFVAELSDGDINYLLSQASPTLQAVLLKNMARHRRAQLLRQMPREQRNGLLRAWADNQQKLDRDGLLRAFHWLRRKVLTRRQFPIMGSMENENEPHYPEVNGTKTLSMILDGLETQQEEKIIHDVMRSDNELAAWLERDRGSARQREILRQVLQQVSNLELALLLGLPRYGRVLRHLLNGTKKLEVLNASIELARLSQASWDKRRKLEQELFAKFPILREY